jgi:hypothetical protein
LTEENKTALIETIHKDDEFLMYVAGMLVDYDTARQNGKFTNPAFKPVWRGSIDFLKNVGKWWDSKKYLSIKQKEAVIKAIERNIDRVIIIWDILDADTTTGSASDVAYFGVEEYDGHCPFCGSNIMSIGGTGLDTGGVTYKCDSCSQIVEYISDAHPTPDVTVTNETVETQADGTEVLTSEDIDKVASMWQDPSGNILTGTEDVLKVFTEFINGTNVSASYKDMIKLINQLEVKPKKD